MTNATLHKLIFITLVFLSVKSFSQLPTNLKNGLVAYYPFNGNVGDSSGNGNNGAVIGTVSYTTDHLNNAKSALVLGSGRIVTSSFFDYQYTDSFTVSFWFQVKDNSSSGRLLSTECPEGNFRIASFGNGISMSLN